ncbi:MAG: SlyX family protein [Planctomycetaceae bacterium]
MTDDNMSCSELTERRQDMADSDGLAERLLKIESAVSHLQRMFEHLNESVLDHESGVRNLRTDLDAMRIRIERATPEPEARDLGDDRPPHY